LEAFKKSNAKQALLDRIPDHYEDDQAVWIQEIPQDGVINFYTRNGFKKREEIVNLNSLPIPSIYLLRKII